MGAYVDAARYYYPHIADRWDSEAASPPQFLDGAEEGASFVPAAFAVSSYEQRDNAAPDSASLSSGDGIRFCFGQSAITEAVMQNYGKHITGLTLVLKSGSSYQLPDDGGSESGAEPPDNGGIPPTGIEEELDREGLMADSLTVTVGYYGGEYYTKKVFSAEERPLWPT